MDAASHLPTTESDSAPEEFSLSEADFYNEIYARYRSENHRALSSENRFWMAQFAESVKGTTMKPFVFPLFQWRHLNTNDRVRSLPEEIQEMVVIELFFQNRYFGSRNKAKREFASVQSLLQSWNAFVTNIAKSGFAHVVSMMLRSKIRFYKLTLKGRKMNVHDLSRNEGHPCGVLASQACPVCFDTALKMDEATRKGLNPGVKISSTLRQAIARLDRDMQRHASAESDAEILSDSDTDILGDSDAEPDGEPMVVVQPLETKPAAPPPTKYVPAATATMKGLFNADRPAKQPASSPPPPPPPSLHPPSRGRPSAMAYCRELEKKLTEEKLARLELERKVVEQNIDLTRVHAICADLRDTIESLVTRLEVEGSLRMNRRRS